MMSLPVRFSDELRGFPLELFKDHKVESKHLCTHCKLILRIPVQSSCGHRFCKDCVEKQFISNPAASPICAMCIEEGETDDDIKILKREEIFPDNAIKRDISNIPVRCYLDGCEWTGLFKNFEDHIVTCVHRKDPCPECQEMIKFIELQDHLTSHRTAIGQMCKFGCGLKIETDVVEHMRSYAVDHFNSISKRVTDLELKLATHREENPTLAMQPLTTLSKFESIEENVKKLEIQLERTMLSYKSSAGSSAAEASGFVGFGADSGIGSSNLFLQTNAALRELPEIQEKMQIYEGVMTVLNREIEKLTIQADCSENLQKADRELFDAMDRKIKTLERQMAMKDATIAELELRTTSLELTSYDGTLVWKIADFSRKRQEAISGRTPSIYSTPFYTSKTGYKMCARIYLNGDGMGRGTHVSLFFVIMRGQYDAMLKWPFRQKVTLMFLDQNNREHVLDAFRPDPTSSSFKRPASEMNIASGCPLFLALTQLDNPANAYIKDNTAFIKIIVNTDEIQL